MKIKARAFTLIELLVVAAILAVVIALLLPAVQAARRAYQQKNAVQAPQPRPTFEHKAEATKQADLLPSDTDAMVPRKDFVALQARLIRLEEEVKQLRERMDSFQNRLQ